MSKIFSHLKNILRDNQTIKPFIQGLFLWVLSNLTYFIAEEGRRINSDKKTIFI